MHSKRSKICPDPHPANHGLNLRRKWILERDEVYNDQSHTLLALEHLSNLNERDSNTEEDNIIFPKSPTII